MLCDVIYWVPFNKKSLPHRDFHIIPFLFRLFRFRFNECFDIVAQKQAKNQNCQQLWWDLVFFLLKRKMHSYSYISNIYAVNIKLKHPWNIYSLILDRKYYWVQLSLGKMWQLIKNKSLSIYTSNRI